MFTHYLGLGCTDFGKCVACHILARSSGRKVCRCYLPSSFRSWTCGHLPTFPKHPISPLLFGFLVPQAGLEVQEPACWVLRSDLCLQPSSSSSQIHFRKSSAPAYPLFSMLGDPFSGAQPRRCLQPEYSDQTSSKIIRPNKKRFKI